MQKFLNLIIFTCLLLADTGVQASDPLALQQIMSDMGKNMQTITQGISGEDWGLVEKTATLIANHPQPHFTEKVEILGFIGTNLGRFREYDAQTRNQARNVGKKARTGDGPAVIDEFQRLQVACYNCHGEFRDLFRERFYQDC